MHKSYDITINFKIDTEKIFFFSFEQWNKY